MKCTHFLGDFNLFPFSMQRGMHRLTLMMNEETQKWNCLSVEVKDLILLAAQDGTELYYS